MKKYLSEACVRLRNIQLQINTLFFRLTYQTSLAFRIQRHEACLEQKNCRSVSLKDWEKELQSEEVIIVDYLLLKHKKEYR